ncbi:hypothetical protein [Fulvivirga imtechensis]|uniref:hypothetical protein n=1 Tax=Fulvivirga imtechensis TaxID=881893 RepID=UPI0012F7C4F5|nr:hypothetical protein [Fulvivirga imtechensis]
MTAADVFVYGQQTINGRVINEELVTVPEAQIYGEDTLLLGQTDLNGYFEIIVPEGINDLAFGWIGHEWASISDYCNYIEVILLYDATYHYRSNRKIDRLRRKRFDELSELHKQAVDGGLFKAATPCYEREFVPIKPQLDEIKEEMKAEEKVNKKYFKKLAVGDTIRIPYSGHNRDREGRMGLVVFSYVVDNESFDCLIEGVILQKNRRNGHNLTYKVTNLDKCNYGTVVYEDNEVTVGSILQHNMKYFKVIKEPKPK